MMTATTVVTTTLVVSTAMAAMTQPEIDRGVQAANDELGACYDAAVERNEDLKTGRMVIRYVVNTDGKVEQARVVRNDLGDRKLASCMRDVFLSLDYGPIDQETVVSYPLDLEP